MSFPDYTSKIVRSGTGVALINNKAQQYALGTFSKVAPAGNTLNDPVDPAEEVALVAAWRARVFPAPAPAPPPIDPVPVPLPDPVQTPTPYDPLPELIAMRDGLAAIIAKMGG